MFEAFQRACQAENRSRAEVVREALRRYLEREGNDRFHVPASLWRKAAALPWREAVARRAYSIFERRGAPEDREVDDWLQSERELDTRKGERRREAKPVEGADRRSGEDRRRASAISAE
jgi:hypothetical protein